MTMPNYFLAELPADATISPPMLEEACRALRRNREKHLAGRTTARIIDLLSRVAQDWLRPEDPYRKLALEQGPSKTPFSSPTIQRGIDSFFSQLTPENLLQLVEQDLGNIGALDDFRALGSPKAASKQAFASGPEMLVHISGGALPNPTWMSMILGLLARSAQFIKCPTGGAFLPLLLAHSLREADSKIASCMELASWHGGNHPLERVLFEHADCLTATGSDATLARIRMRLPPGIRFVAHGHRVSFGFVSSSLQTQAEWTSAITGAAQDVAAWNQLGCLSPHVIYVQTGGALAGQDFAKRLAAELEKIEIVEPRGALTSEGAAVIASRRSIYALRAANSPETFMWASTGSTAWTVVYEADARFQTSCLNRFIYVKSVASLKEALQAADVVRKSVSTVGLAANEAEIRGLTLELAQWGATRVCPLGQMQAPPLTWRRDGHPPLGEIITWTDWERA